MIDRAEQKDAAHPAARRGHPKPASESAANATSPDLLTPENLAGIQRAAGNASTAELVSAQSPAGPASAAGRATAAPAPASGPARPHIGPETEAIMRSEVHEIVAMFQEMWLSASEEDRIVGFVEKYAQLDEDYQKETGYTGTDNLDRFLLMLKTSSYLHATLSSVGIDQTYNTYDQMWRELKESRLERFKAVVARSHKQATSGPEEPAPEAFDWAKLGKQEGMGLWGISKGISTGLVKLVDTGTDSINWISKKLGYDLKPIHYADMVGDQFDEAGQAMFGASWKARKKPGEPEPQLTPEQKRKQEEEDRENELFYGITPQDLGTAGGDVIFSLAMMSGGGGAAGEVGNVSKVSTALKTAVKAQKVAKGLEDIADKAQEMFDMAAEVAYEVRKKEGEAASFIGPLLAKVEFQQKIWELAAAILETVLAGAAEGDETAKLLEKMIVPALKGNITMTKGAKLIDIAGDTKMSPEERKKATGEALIDFIKEGYLLLGGLAAHHDKEKADEAAKAEAERKQAEQTAASVARQQNEPHMNVGNVDLPEGGEAPELDRPDQPGASGKPKGFDVDKVLVGDEALSGGFKESTLKDIAIKKWSEGGGNQLVKVVSIDRGPGEEAGGYVTELKYVAGRTPAEMEQILGLPAGELGNGAVVQRLDGIPKPDDFKLKAYTQLPGGKTYEEGTKYPPGLGAPQWVLTKPLPVGDVTVVSGSDAYRPGAANPVGEPTMRPATPDAKAGTLPGLEPTAHPDTGSVAAGPPEGFEGNAVGSPQPAPSRPPSAGWDDLEAAVATPVPRQQTGGFRSQQVRQGNREVITIEGTVGQQLPQSESLAGYTPTLSGEHATHAVGMQLGENLPEGITSGPAGQLNLSAMKVVENATRDVFDAAATHAADLGDGQPAAAIETKTTLHLEHQVVNGEQVPVLVGVKREAWLRFPGSDESHQFIDFEVAVDPTTRTVTPVRNSVERPPK